MVDLIVGNGLADGVGQRLGLKLFDQAQFDRRPGESAEVGIEAEDLAVVGLEGFKKPHGVLKTRILDRNVGLVGGQHLAVEVNVITAGLG